MATINVGEIYRDRFKSINGGWGLVPWYSLNYLKPEEFPLWLKICEFSYKNTKGDNVVHLTKKWIYDYFENEGGEEYVEGVLSSLSGIGYIDVNRNGKYIDIEINYHIVKLAIQFIGKNRPYAQKLREFKKGLCEHDFKKYDTNISSIEPEDLIEVDKLMTEGKEV